MGLMKKCCRFSECEKLSYFRLFLYSDFILIIKSYILSDTFMSHTPTQLPRFMPRNCQLNQNVCIFCSICDILYKTHINSDSYKCITKINLNRTEHFRIILSKIFARPCEKSNPIAISFIKILSNTNNKPPWSKQHLYSLRTDVFNPSKSRFSVNDDASTQRANAVTRWVIKASSLADDSRYYPFIPRPKRKGRTRGKGTGKFNFPIDVFSSKIIE